MITKDFKVQLKELDRKNRKVEGYFSAFNVKDSDNDIIQKGAFSKSINENGPKGTGRIKHLYNHWNAVGVLEELSEDNFGLRFKSKIGNHTIGNDVLNMYMDGIITEHSIGFQLVEGKWEQMADVRILKEVELWEGSSLDRWGANMYTPVIKSKEQFEMYYKQWEDRYNSLTKALRNRTNYSDETYDLLIIQLEVLKSAFNNVLKDIQPKQFTVTDEPHGVDYEKILTNLKF